MAVLSGGGARTYLAVVAAMKKLTSDRPKVTKY